MYRDLNDYEVLYLVKENDDVNFEIIYKKYTPLVYKLASKYESLCKRFGYEFNDIMQLGYIALFKATNAYQYDSSMFYTYVTHVIENSIISEIRKNNTLKSKTLNECISYDVLIPNTENRYIDIIPSSNSIIDILDSFISEHKWIVFKNTLSFTLSCIFELKYNGYQNYEISKLLDISLGDVIKGLKLIKKQLLYI